MDDNMICGNCGHDEKYCPVPTKFCNWCINRDECSCNYKGIDEPVKVRAYELP